HQATTVQPNFSRFAAICCVEQNGIMPDSPAMQLNTKMYLNVITGHGTGGGAPSVAAIAGNRAQPTQPHTDKIAAGLPYCRSRLGTAQILNDGRLLKRIMETA